jgi:putative selenium metabolism hydrolase
MTAHELMEKRARDILPDAVHFLREIVAIPSMSGKEEAVARRVAREMMQRGFDEVSIDDFGSVIGRVGEGPRTLLYDAHIDTVGVGDPKAWPHDPFKGKHDDGWIWGRGTSDNKGGLAAIVFGAALAKDVLPLEITLQVVGSAMEEDCDGIAYKTILDAAGESGLTPEAVLLAECTDLAVYRGHRGRMEITVTVRGTSCHASAPERGVNAIYGMIAIVHGIEALNERLADDAFLGRGSVAVTRIEGSGPSLNAVPDQCTIFLDRRLTAGETKASALAEIEAVVAEVGAHAEVEVLVHRAEGWTGKKVEMEKYFPTWTLDEGHPAFVAGLAAAGEALGRPAEGGRWTFSTNGVSTAGLAGIPTLGFGPAKEEYAHSVGDRVSEEDLLRAILFYALYPGHYVKGTAKG